MNKFKKEKDKDNYFDYIKMLLKPNEKIENLDDLLREVSDTYISKQEALKKLYQEIKIIKKLEV